MWYAIRHKASGRFLHGTDFNYGETEQRLSDDNHAPKLFSDVDLEGEIIRRQISPDDFEVVTVEILAKGTKAVTVSYRR